MKCLVTITLSSLLALACGETSSGNGGSPAGGGGAGGQAPGSGGEGGTAILPPDDPEQCPLQETEPDCIALRCFYRDAVLFPELVCSAGVPAHACTWFDTSNGALTAPAAYSRQTPAGLLTTTVGEQYPGGPVGFTICADPAAPEPSGCDCLPP